MAAAENFIIDFSDIPGCQSPPSSLRSSVSSTRLTTRSRISSIFSSNAGDLSDDDTFDLKASARKFKPKRESKIHTGRLIDIDSPSTNCPLTDWERLEQEAKAIAGQLGKNDRKINFDELLAKSPLNSSPLCSIKEDMLCPTSPDHVPRKSLFNDNFQEPIKKVVNKENLVDIKDDNRKEVYIDDQLERAIRKPLGTLNMGTPIKIKPPTPSKLKLPTPSKLRPPTPTKIKPPTPLKLKPPTPTKLKPLTPSKLMKPPMTPISTFKKTPMISSGSAKGLRTPMAPGSTKSMRTPMTPKSSVPMRPSFGTPSLRVMTPASNPGSSKSSSTLPRRGSMTPSTRPMSRASGSLPKRPSGAFTPLPSTSSSAGALSRRPSAPMTPVQASTRTPGALPRRPSTAFTGNIFENLIILHIK